MTNTLPGIDVQAELCAKTTSPNLGPTHVTQPLVQPPPIQRAIMNRHHQSRKSTSSVGPKLETNVGATQMSTPPQPASVLSPKSRPTPPSHANSPSSSGQPFGSQRALSPPVSDSMSLHASAPPAAARNHNHPLSPVPASPAMSRPDPGVPHQATARSARAPVATGPPSVASTSAAGFYPTPAFQSHMDQLGAFTPLLPCLSM
ncbi:hypothetical protein IMZ48_04855 [Candidatus Bathyarchaeota archaeon]|nr:hypothetical protein [Candidatus Bathyarchaeota archaeon]